LKESNEEGEAGHGG